MNVALSARHLRQFRPELGDARNAFGEQPGRLLYCWALREQRMSR